MHPTQQRAQLTVAGSQPAIHEEPEARRAGCGEEKQVAVGGVEEVLHRRQDPVASASLVLRVEQLRIHPSGVGERRLFRNHPRVPVRMYLEAWSKVVFGEPRRPRLELAWSREDRALVAERAASFGFLASYDC